ncbi:PREDICTED: protein FAM205A-like [Chrysochloris asiatica]|uniref:Protein FAM205A-like n=1 Tax=Chrysochloris asiatica TaxID=185453 RepID=A0A9B0TKT9_CHRAS|nr:PREDICTED: protein FAM205A-like [Chrysochloris asiatica]
MLSPTFFLWDVGYPLYTYGSIFMIILIIWQLKRSQQGLRLGPKRTCYRCHQRIRQRSRERTTKARRVSQEEAEKLRKLLSLMKSQSWLPQEGSVRRLLCADPCCHICNDVALEIQQLLEGKKSLMVSTSAKASQQPSYLENMSMSGISELSVKLSSKHTRELSLTSVTTTLTQVTDQKSLTQTAAPSTVEVSIQHYWNEHLQLGKECQLPAVSWGSEALCSSSLEELGIPVNQQEREKSNSESVLEKEGQVTNQLPLESGTRVRDRRALHCGPRAALGRSVGRRAAAERWEQAARAEQQAEAAAREPETHTPSLLPAARDCGA